jgi:hypothetical protein
MKIEIKIEADKDSMEKIQKQFSTISAGIGTVIKFLEQFEVGLTSKKATSSTPLETETAATDVVKDETIDEITEEIVPEKDVASDVETETASLVTASSTDIEVPVGEEAVTSQDEAAEQAKVVAPTSPEKKPAPAKPASKKSSTKKTKQAKTTPASKKTKTKAKKKTVGKKVRVTAGMAVLKHIKKSDTGLDSKNLEKKTGFSAKKVADTVYKLKKDGLIQKTDQGLFVAI